jgi:transcriptional regulator with XRE-family HTH domain
MAGVSTRTVTPNGDAIARLQIQRGMDEIDFARAAGCSLGTLQNLKAGKRALIATLKRMSEKLKCPYPQLLAGGEDASIPTIPEGMIEIKLVLPVSLKDLDETHPLFSILASLNKLCGFKGNVEVGGISNGSTIITLWMTPEDAQMLSNTVERMYFAAEFTELVGIPVKVRGTLYFPRSAPARDTRLIAAWIRRLANLFKSMKFDDDHCSIEEAVSRFIESYPQAANESVRLAVNHSTGVECHLTFQAEGVSPMIKLPHTPSALVHTFLIEHGFELSKAIDRKATYLPSIPEKRPDYIRDLRYEPYSTFRGYLCNALWGLNCFDIIVEILKLLETPDHVEISTDSPLPT